MMLDVRTTRFWVCLLLMIGYTLSTALQLVLSMSLVCMVNATAVSESGNVSANKSQCAAMRTVADKSPDGPFVWYKEDTAWLFAAFFFGNFIIYFPGGWLLYVIGAKRVVLAAMAVQIVATALSPLAAEAHWHILLIARIFVGVGQGIMSPCVNDFVAKWVLPTERSMCLSLVTTGTQLGAIIAMPVTAAFCTLTFAGGWPLAFYTFAIISALWCIVWWIYVTDTPDTHRWISIKEKLLFEARMPQQRAANRGRLPLKSMLLSGPVWAIIAATCSFRWGLTTIQNFLPSYLDEVLALSISENGVGAMIPWIVQAVSKFISAFAAGLVIKKQWCSKTVSTKIFNTISLFGMGVFICAAAFVNCGQEALAVLLISLALFCLANMVSGFMVCMVSIAPAYSSIVSSIGFFFGSIVSIIGPIAVNATTADSTAQEWQRVFFITLGIMTLGAVIFLIFGSAEVQPWALPNEMRDNVSETSEPNEEANITKDSIVDQRF